MTTLQIVGIIGVPSLVMGIILWYIKRYFDKRDKKEETRERARIKNNVLLLMGVSASLALGEATAEAIKTQRCNGEMEEARVYALQVKHQIKDFMYQQGSENLT